METQTQLFFAANLIFIAVSLFSAVIKWSFRQKAYKEHFERLFRGVGGYPSTSAKADPTPSEYSETADGCDAGEGEHEQRGGLCFGGACPQNKMESHDHGHAEE